MRILIIGDVVGRPARRAVRGLIPAFVAREGIDLVVANAENSAGGMGVDIKSAEELFAAGVHVLTSGNHIWRKKEIFRYLDESRNLIRPVNFPDGAPGRGWCAWDNGRGARALIINVQGRVFMPQHVDDPFRSVDEVLKEQGHHSPVVIVDVHAEATSEKNALGWYLNGRVSVVFGTHTHVQTADERVLPGGTAYITDVGMCGAFDSVIGMERDPVIEGFLSQLPRKFEIARDNIVVQGIVVEVNDQGRALEIRRVRLHWDEPR